MWVSEMGVVDWGDGSTDTAWPSLWPQQQQQQTYHQGFVSRLF